MFDDRIGNLQKMLARMGPEGRQKYATDHADDPIAVSMALFVNNIAKELKEGKQGEPNMPPPVVQQAIQSMTQPQMPQGGPPPQGPPQGMPPQGPQQGMPPQGMPPQGMPPPQQAPQGMLPPQGQPQMAANGGYMDSRLPEEMGIGALPERSLSNMADGGIVGYAGGGVSLPGLPPGVQLSPEFLDQWSKALPQDKAAMLARELQARAAFRGAPVTNVPAAPSVPSNPYAPATPGTSYESAQGARGANVLRNLGSAAGSGAGLGVLAGGSLLSRAAAGNLSSRSDEELDTLSNAGGGDDTAFASAILREARNTPTVPATPTAPAKPVPNATPSVATMPTDATRRGDVRFPAKAAPGAGPGAAPNAAPGAAPRAAPGAGFGAGPGAGSMSIAELQKLQQSLIPTGREADPYAAEHAEAAKLRENQGKLELADAETRKAGLAALLAPREQRIKNKEERLQKNDDMNVNMSLINAGLAMMQSRGQGLAGIAEGAGVGVKQYSEGLKLSEAARQKIEDAKDAFDELKFNQTNMSQKEVTAAKRTIAEGAIATQNETIAGIKEATGFKRADAKDVFDNFVKSRDASLDRASRERTAAFSAQVQKEIAAMPGANEKFYATLGKGDAKAGLDYFVKATAEGKGDEAIMLAVIKSPEILGAINPTLRKVIEQQIAARFPPPTVPGSAVPSAGQVRAP